MTEFDSCITGYRSYAVVETSYLIEIGTFKQVGRMGKQVSIAILYWSEVNAASN